MEQTAHIYAETQQLCETRLTQFTAEPTNYTGQTTEIKEVSEIKVIGAWKPNRFITLPQGFYVCVSYKVIPS